MAKTCKYVKRQRYVSYDSGVTWSPLQEFQRGAFIESNSVDCGGGTTMYRWQPTSSTTCIGYDKWQLSVYQESTDNGTTWQNVSGVSPSATTMIEANSTDCGYIPPTPIEEWRLVQNDWYCEVCGYVPSSTTKFQATYSGGQTYSAECDSNTTLTSGDTHPSGYEYSAMTSAVIESCITAIGENAFRSCSGLTSVTIPNSVTSIGGTAFIYCYSLSSIDIPTSVTSIYSSAFKYCSALASVTIPSSVTWIGREAFNYCRGLTSITCLATTPPSLGGSNIFNQTNNCPIYVPSSSVNAYKSANVWNNYASRIQGI